MDKLKQFIKDNPKLVKSFVAFVLALIGWSFGLTEEQQAFLYNLIINTF